MRFPWGKVAGWTGGCLIYALVVAPLVFPGVPVTPDFWAGGVAMAWLFWTTTPKEEETRP